MWLALKTYFSIFLTYLLTLYHTTISHIAYRSSPGYRNTQRLNAGAEVLGMGVVSLTNPSGEIPTKVLQLATSSYSLILQDTKLPEKLVHGLQISISGTQLGLNIASLFNGSNCGVTNSTDCCKALFLCLLLYRGVLLLGWVPSEFSKNPYDNSLTNTANSSTTNTSNMDSVITNPNGNTNNTSNEQEQNEVKITLN